MCISLNRIVMVIVAVFGAHSAIVRAADPTTKPADASPAQVTIDAYWLRLTPAQLKPGQSTVAPALLDDADALYAHARIVGPEGDQITAAVNRNVDVVTGATPVVAPGASAYDLTTSTRQFGVTLTETPTLVQGDLQVVFDSTVTMQEPQPARQPGKAPATQPADPANQPNPIAVDAARNVSGSAVSQIHAQSTIHLKPGVPTIVSGVSDRPGADSRTLCLVLFATLDSNGKK